MENFNGDFPFSNEETKLDLNIIQTICDNYFETHPPETLRFAFPITYDTNIGFRGASPVIRYDYKLVQH